MNPRWPNACPAIPAFRSSAPDRSTGRRHRATAADRAETLDPAHMASAERAVSIRRQHGPVFDAYAGCDRSPWGWERTR